MCKYVAQVMQVHAFFHLLVVFVAMKLTIGASSRPILLFE